MSSPHPRRLVGVLATLTLFAAACGSDDESSDADAEPAATDDTTATTTADTAGTTNDELPTIVVTTNILGDVVGEVLGDSAEVVTIMPVGADPHDFQASAQDVDRMMNADALIVNGGGLEEGLLDAIESVEESGVPTFEALNAVETIEFGEGGHDHADEDHADEEKDEDHDHEGEEKDEDHSDEDHADHDHSGDDPHFWMDPMRMAEAVEAMVDFLDTEIAFADPEAIATSAAAYVDELEAIDAESVTMFEAIENRVLVTNHDSLGYFADHYGFEVAGTVIPSGTTTDSASAGEIAELADVIQEEQVPAIFADNTASDELAQTLAAEVGSDVEVIEIYTGSLGEPGSEAETYLLMLTTNAERITAGLA